MEGFINKQKELIKIEHECEVEDSRNQKFSLSFAELQKRGICIRKLHLASIRTGLYGRTILSLKLKYEDASLPSNRFSSGDIVEVFKSGENPTNTSNSLSGVLLRITDKTIQVALDNDDDKSEADVFDNQNSTLTILKTSNEITYRRLKSCLDKLRKHESMKNYNLIDICFSTSLPSQPVKIIEDIKWQNNKLNKSQKEAVEFALNQKEIALIHGPPGTGKTTTVIELILQLVNLGNKILACAPSNVAVDNLVEKLHNVYKTNVKMVRLGHPARILPSSAQKTSLDAILSRSDASAILSDIKQEIDNIMKTKKRNNNKGVQHKNYQEKKLLLKELKQREGKAIKEILMTADVILCTTVGAHDKGPLKNLPPNYFDVAIVDECGQGLEIGCWIPILHARKCILAGDHLQLPPTVVSKEAGKDGLSISLLERIAKKHEQVVKMLTMQYRMNQSIMKWASDCMYESRLVAHQSVASHLLSDLPNVTETEETSIPILLIDTAGCNMPEIEGEDGDSKGNEGEVELVIAHVKDLIKAGISPDSIAVISPYNLQVDLLRTGLLMDYPALEIKSVDGFQGREKEAVVLSLVRSNDAGDVGFLSDNRRLNVAVTRARRHIAIICDSITVSSDKFLQGLVDYMMENGEVRSASQYANEITHTVVGENLPSINNKPLKNQCIKAKPELSAEEKAMKHKEFHQQINAFVLQSEKEGVFEMEFPSSLTSLDRMIIHEICEKIKLKHTSIGEGKDRRITVSIKRKDAEDNYSMKASANKLSSSKEEKTNKQDTRGIQNCDDINVSVIEDQYKQKNIENETAIPSYETTDEHKRDKETSKVMEHMKQMDLREKKEDETNYSVCEKCGKELPFCNMKMHLIHCERLFKMKEAIKNKKHESKANSNKNQKKHGKNKKSSGPLVLDDALLDESATSNKFCSHSSCNTYVTTVGQLCHSCKKMYCFSHHLPEVHGCGKTVHANARRQISRDGFLQSGSGVTNKKLQPAKRAALQRRLNEKVSEKEKSRKSKKSK